MPDLGERVSRLEAWARRARVFSYIRYAIYALIIVGVVLYGYSLYRSAGEWKVELADTPRVGLESPRVVSVRVPLRIFNPDGEVMAKLVYYRVYIEDYYAGDGFVPYLHLPSRWSEHVFTVELDVSRASCGRARALAEGSNATVRVEGYAMVDLKTFGGLTWRTVTLPFNYTATQVPLPQLDAATRSLLQLYLYACNHSDTILGIIQTITSRPGGGQGFIPIPPAPGAPGQGQSISPLNLSVEVRPAGITTLNVTVTIENTGADTVVIYNVTINGEVQTLNVQLPPGAKLTISGETNRLPVDVVVYSSAGRFERFIYTVTAP